jgi:hypothetical protein
VTLSMRVRAKLTLNQSFWFSLHPKLLLQSFKQLPQIDKIDSAKMGRSVTLLHTFDGI